MSSSTEDSRDRNGAPEEDAVKAKKDREYEEAVQLLALATMPSRPKRQRWRRKAEEDFAGFADRNLTMAVVKMRDKRQDIALKKILAWASVGFVTFQLLVANVFFGFYLWHAREQTPNSIMMAWLSATVIEVIAILGIIARSLFPARKNRRQGDVARVE